MVRVLRAVFSVEPLGVLDPADAGLAYQLMPLRMALLLPCVNLLIADDAGLGKTIEAGLELRELLLRRRVDFTLVAS